MSFDVPEVNDGMRQRIAMARVICILCMIYVHVPSALPTDYNHSLQAEDIAVSLQGFVIEGLGRASAALLSVLSGYLMAVVLSKPGLSLSALYRRRFQSLMVPMFVWSFLTLLVYLLVSTWQPTFLTEANTGDLLSTLWAYLNFFLFLTELPMGPTMHLAFLRDLFVCILVGPLLAMLVRHAALPLLLLVSWLYLADLESVFILRPLILFAYVIGLTLAIKNVDMRALDKFWPLFLSLSVISSLLILLAHGGAFASLKSLSSKAGLDFIETLLYPLSRLFGSLVIWTFLAQCVGSRIGRKIQGLSPWLFAAYCSHYLVLSLLWQGLWLPLTGADSGSLYLVWFLAGPAVSMGMAWVMIELSARSWPALATVLTGGRRARFRSTGAEGRLGVFRFFRDCMQRS